VVRGRTVDVAGILDGMAEQWELAMAVLDGRYGS